MNKTGCYLYGLIRATDNLEFGDIGLEHEGKPGHVYTLREDSIAAVVTPYAGRGKILPLRKNLEPHNRVIREVMRTTTIVPMTFGHVAKSEDEVRKMLRRNRADILEQLGRVDGKVEMGLKIVWSVDNIFDYFLSIDPELKALRDDIFGQTNNPSQTEKIELGRMFEQRITREREEQTELVLEMLQPWAVESKVNPPRGEKTIMDLAFLVDRQGLKPFEECVYQAADMFPAQYIFDFTGPWAPFNFIELDLQQAAA